MVTLRWRGILKVCNSTHHLCSSQEKKPKPQYHKKIIFLSFHSYVWNVGGNAQIPNKLLIQNNYLLVGEDQEEQEDLATTNLNAISANLVQFHWRQSEIDPDFCRRNLENRYDDWAPGLFPWFLFLACSGKHLFSLPSKTSFLYRVMQCLCSFYKYSA